MDSMRLTIEYWNQARTAAGRDGETIELATGALPVDVVRHLADRHGGRLRSLLLGDDAQPRPSTMVSVNGELAPCRLPRPLRDGDVVALLLPIAGG
jgi:molybdopterin converting factor small subunit